jgi:AcrR family transcriptional regulator
MSAKTPTKERIVEAALKIAQRQGIDAVTARSLALALKSSTAPVYYVFSNMDDLKAAVMKRARDLLVEYTKRQYHQWPVANIGLGIVHFAIDNCCLYRLLFMENNRQQRLIDEFNAGQKKTLKADPMFKRFTGRDYDQLAQRLWLATHGLASLMCVKLIKAKGDQQVQRMVIDTCKPIIDAMVAEVNRRKK